MRWTMNKKMKLDALYGSMPDKKVASILGISVQALRKQVSIQNLSSKRDRCEYTASDVADILGISVKTVINYINKDMIKAHKIDKYYNITEDNLIAFMKAYPNKWDSEKARNALAGSKFDFIKNNDNIINRKYSYWSTKEIDILKKMIAADEKLDSICSKINKPYNTIKRLYFIHK
jgi:DNA-binding transcriptional MerR regulator